MIELYLGATSGGWALDGRSRGWDAHADAAAGLDRWAGEIAATCATRWRRARVTLWLSGGLARPLLRAPVAGLRGWREAQALAAAAAPEATGLAGPCVVRLEDWLDAAPALATAIDESLGAAIVQAARDHRIAWRSVRPWWAAVLEDALRQRRGARVVAVAEDDALTLLGGPAHPLSGLSADAAFDQAASYAPPPDRLQATALWHRTLLSRDVAADDAWFAWLPAVDARASARDESEATAHSFWPRPVWTVAGGAP